MGISKKDMHKQTGKRDEKMAKLETLAASGSERAKKKLVKEKRK
jgi:hypothetical protein